MILYNDRTPMEKLRLRYDVIRRFQRWSSMCAAEWTDAELAKVLGIVQATVALPQSVDGEPVRSRQRGGDWRCQIM